MIKKITKRSRYIVLTSASMVDAVEDSEINQIIEEVNIILQDNGLNMFDWYYGHFPDSVFFDEFTAYDSLHSLIEYLAIKEGADLVRFDNGRLGFVAVYGNNKSMFEIVKPR